MRARERRLDPLALLDRLAQVARRSAPRRGRSTARGRTPLQPRSARRRARCVGRRLTRRGRRGPTRHLPHPSARWSSCRGTLPERRRQTDHLVVVVVQVLEEDARDAELAEGPRCVRRRLPRCRRASGCGVRRRARPDRCRRRESTGSARRDRGRRHPYSPTKHAVITEKPRVAGSRPASAHARSSAALRSRSSSLGAPSVFTSVA